MKTVWIFFAMIGVYCVNSQLVDLTRELQRIGPTLSCAMMSK